MSWVVFLRGVNVGAHNRFQPSLLAKQLAPLRVANIGAAGTLIVFDSVNPDELRAAILRQLPMTPELMLIRGPQIIELVKADPFKGEKLDGDRRAFVTVLLRPPVRPPRFPIYAPSETGWQVKVLGGKGNWLLSIWHREVRRILYPNEVVEKAFGMASTTRSWNTIEKIARMLDR